MAGRSWQASLLSDGCWVRTSICLLQKCSSLAITCTSSILMLWLWFLQCSPTAVRGVESGMFFESSTKWSAGFTHIRICVLGIAKLVNNSTFVSVRCLVLRMNIHHNAEWRDRDNLASYVLASIKTLKRYLLFNLSTWQSPILVYTLLL